MSARVLPLLSLASALSCLVNLPAFTAASPLTDEGHLEWFLVEELPARTPIGDVAVDYVISNYYTPQQISNLTYLLHLSANATTRSQGALFEIDSESSVVRTAVQIDRDDPELCEGRDLCVIWIQVEAHLQGGEVAQHRNIDIRVEIVDLNDNTPIWLIDSGTGGGAVSLSVSEGSTAGMRFPLPVCNDPDGPEYGITRYELVNNHQDHFRLVITDIAGGTRHVDLELSAPLDREEKASYVLIITAYDGGEPAKHSSLTVLVNVLDENDNTPTFERSTYEIYVPEHSMLGGIIAVVSATDHDSGARGEVTYSFSSDNSREIEQLFSIDGSSGQIRMQRALDFEEGALYVINVDASDNVAFPKVGHTTVVVRVEDINDNSPLIQVNTLTGLEYAQIAENSPQGQTVAQLYVSDSDAGQNGNVECELDHEYFELDAPRDSQYRILTSSEPLDRETREAHSVDVVCHDGGEPRRQETVRVRVHVTDVNDNTPRFNQQLYHGLVVVDDQEEEHEDDDTSQWTVTVKAEDPDEGLNGYIRYEVHSEVRHVMQVGPHTGIIRVVSDTNIREMVGMEFRVIAHDMGLTRRTATATVSIVQVTQEDLAPIFDQEHYPLSVYENQPFGSSVGMLTVKDEFLDTHLQYSLDSSQDAELFSIDSTTGRITTNAVLDREFRPVYYLNAFVSVSPLVGTHYHTSTASVSIYIADTNDQRPELIFPSAHNNTIRWSQTQQITENTRMLTQIKAIDADLTENGIVTYSLESSDTYRLEGIRVDRASGVVTLDESFWSTAMGSEALLTGRIHLIVKATDHGDPPLETRGILYVDVQELTEHRQLTTTRATTPAEATSDQDVSTLSKDEATLVVALTASVLLLLFVILFSVMIFLIYKRSSTKDKSDPLLPACSSCLRGHGDALDDNSSQTKTLNSVRSSIMEEGQLEPSTSTANPRYTSGDGECYDKRQYQQHQGIEGIDKDSLTSDTCVKTSPYIKAEQHRDPKPLNTMGLQLNQISYDDPARQNNLRHFNSDGKSDYFLRQNNSSVA